MFWRRSLGAMQTHYSRPKGFRKTRLNAKRYTSFQLKNSLNIQFFFVFCSCARFETHQNPKFVGFWVNLACLKILLNLCFLFKCWLAFLLVSYWEFHYENFVAHPRSLKKFPCQICDHCCVNGAWNLHRTSSFVSFSQPLQYLILLQTTTLLASHLTFIIISSIFTITYISCYNERSEFVGLWIYTHI